MEDIVPHKNMFKYVNTQNSSQLSKSAEKRKLEHLKAVMTLGANSPKLANRVLFEDAEKQHKRLQLAKCISPHLLEYLMWN